jgi:acetolactate synthase-1/2/3 large subunit
MKMSAAQAVVEVLKAEGVTTVFGLPGGHTVPLYEALYSAPEIKHILVRHEQFAATMAAGYAQLTGTPGVCCATAGPGATNLVTGIAEAYFGALPVIILAGRGATGTSQRGACQELAQDKIFAPITKWALRVDRADMVPEMLRRAFAIARSGKPGPVLLDLPVDVLATTIEFSGYVPAGSPSLPRGDSRLVQAAAAALLAAQQPLIIAGGGTVASGASAELRRLAESVAAPVLTTLSGRGSFPDDHPLAGGGLGLHRTAPSKRLLAEADFVLGLGCRFEEMETCWVPDYLPASDACYVQVDSDPQELGKSIHPKIGILSDIRLLLEDLLAAVRQAGGPDHQKDFKNLPRIRDLVQSKVALEAAIESQAAATAHNSPMSALRVITKIRDVFTRDATAAIDIGMLAQALGGAYPYFKVYEPRSCIPCTSFYAMGYAASALPVAKLVYPDRPAVGLCGDGTFAMIMSQLLVAAEHRLPVTWCILNNKRFGSIKDIPREGAKEPYIPIPVDLEVQADFRLVAEACQCYGEKVEDPAQIEPALRRALDANNRGIPAVIDFIVKREWPQSGHDLFAALFGGGDK